MILIADSGSSKTDWRIINNKTVKEQYSTIGLNPFFVDSKTVALCLQNFNNKEEVSEVYFYGAGCVNDEKKDIIKYGIASVFFNAEIFVEDDLTGAARALYNNDNGVAAILGTGMSIAYYDGKIITDRGVSLGFILGDEGSGAHIGKEVLRAYLYGEFPKDIESAFNRKYNTNKNEILNSVYKLPFPNRYIAGFTIFAAENIKNRYVGQLVLKCFDEFFTKHVNKFKEYKNINLRLTGSVAFNFEKQLKVSAINNKFSIDIIIQSPIDQLIEYHQ